MWDPSIFYSLFILSHVAVGDPYIHEEEESVAVSILYTCYVPLWILIISTSSRQSTYKSHQLFICGFQILIWIATWFNPIHILRWVTSWDGLRNPHNPRVEMSTKQNNWWEAVMIVWVAKSRRCVAIDLVSMGTWSEERVLWSRAPISVVVKFSGEYSQVKITECKLVKLLGLLPSPFIVQAVGRVIWDTVFFQIKRMI